MDRSSTAKLKPEHGLGRIGRAVEILGMKKGTIQKFHQPVHHIAGAMCPWVVIALTELIAFSHKSRVWLFIMPSGHAVSAHALKRRRRWEKARLLGALYASHTRFWT